MGHPLPDPNIASDNRQGYDRTLTGVILITILNFYRHAAGYGDAIDD